MGRLANLEALQPGTVLAGRYRVERTVGQGSMGIVVEASDLTLHMRVALKVMSPERANNEEARKRFVREAQAVLKLSNEHVTRMYEVGSLADGVPFLVMEYLVGNTLEQLLFSADGPLALDVVLDWSLQALEGLAEAHRLGFVHRDVKPENLFLHEPPGQPPIVKVLDFGAVKELMSKMTKLTRTGSTMGSPAYMPPEQVRAEDNIDQRADVWAMGVTIYELLTGKLPFGGESVPQTLAAILRDVHIPLRTHRPDVPMELEALIACALDKDRQRRYPNCGEMLEALKAVRAKLQQTSPVTKTLFFNPPSTPRPRAASVPDVFAETSAMRNAPPIPGEDSSRVRDKPRVVINERGQVVTVDGKKASSGTPILPFVIAIASGLLVAGIVVLIVMKTTGAGSARHVSPAPAASASVRANPRHP
jgi:serine/threonine-protein kinase